MKRALFCLASAALLPACVATETGNPPFTVEDESFVVQQVSPPAPGDPITTTIDAPAGAVDPAAGQLEVHLLDGEAPVVSSPVQPDGSFSVSFDERGGERFRLLVRDGADASAPLDVVAGFAGLTAIARTECLVVRPVAAIETSTVVVQNNCDFSVTRGPASFRLPSSATVEEDALEVGAGMQAEIRIGGLGADNTLLIPLLSPSEELRAVTFLSP